MDTVKRVTRKLFYFPCVGVLSIYMDIRVPEHMNLFFFLPNIDSLLALLLWWYQDGAKPFTT